MKTQRNFFFVLVMFFTTTFSLNANPGFETRKMIVRIKKNGDNAINVQIANMQNLLTEVSLVDLKGKSWFSEFVWNENGYAKKMNLTKIPEGTYVLYIKNKREKHLQVFAKNVHDITFFETHPESKNKDVLPLLTSNNASTRSNLITHITIPDNQVIGIQLANLQEKATVVRLNSLSGVDILRVEIKGENEYAQKFDFAGVSTGDYYFLIRTGKTVQIQFVTVGQTDVELGSWQILNDQSIDKMLTAK